MKKKEVLNNLKMEDLKEKLVALRENVRAIKFSMQGSKTKNVKEIFSIKKEIARVLTAINKNNKNK
ncbi:MAG: 50S ribosomal protein L29 [Patescibacteria group bacterium]